MSAYIVTLKQRDQLDGFYADMKSGGYTCLHKRPISRATYYELTESEATTIAGDSRVLAVELHPSEDPSIKWGIDGYVNNEVAAAGGDFYKGSTTDSDDYQWGTLHCAGDDGQRRKNVWGSGAVTDTVEWFNNGKHVDVVICDDNCAYDCQDWYSTLDPAKNRFVQYDWFAEHNSQVIGGIDDDGYSSPGNNYTSYFPNAGHTEYHGHHCTGTVAGKHYGWAREANIYNMQLLSGMGTPIDPILAFDYLRAFHNYKAINPETGHRNPTITNHSWSYRYDYEENHPSGFDIGDITNIHFKGVTYDSSNPGPNGWNFPGVEKDFGFGQWHRKIPIYYTSVAADIEDAIEDGVVVIGAAGNTDFYVASNSQSPYWNNYVTFSTYGLRYYNRGSSPANAPGAISVGSLDKASDFSKSWFSNYGEAVDVWAPGTDIVSVFNPQGYNDAKYGGDNYFATISGTSMASPQVCGIAACLATGKERFTNSDLKCFLQNYCKDGDMTFDDTYTASRHQPWPITIVSTANGWDVTGPDRYGGHVNAINPTIEIFEGDTVEFTLAGGNAAPLYITSSPVTGLTGGATPQGQVSWFSNQGAINPGGSNAATPPWPGSAGDYYYVCGDMTLSFTSWPQGILRVHPPLHFDDSHIGAGSVNKYILAANPRPVADGFPSRWYQQQLKGRRRDEEAVADNPPNMQLYPRENVYHRGLGIHQLNATYVISVSNGYVDEGSSWTTTITTTNVPDNTTLYWELSGTGIVAGDFSSGALTGSGTIVSDTFNFSHTISNDTSTEGNEVVVIKLYTDSARTKQVGNELSVTINDTSLAPVEQEFTNTASTTNFVVPAGVTNLSCYAIGGGGGGGHSNNQGAGAGGGLVWTDNVTVTPGETLIVGVGEGGIGGTQDYGGYQPPGTVTWGGTGTTSYIKRQSNNNFILKAYGGGGSGGRGGQGVFNEGEGLVKAGGDAHNYSGTQGGGTGQYQWTQGGNSAFKGQPGGAGSGGSGAGGAALKEGTTGSSGGSGNTGTPGGHGGDGGLYGAGGGVGAGSGYYPKGGDGADGGVLISWGTNAGSSNSFPIGGGYDVVDGRHSINFISKNDPDYIEFTPAAADGFQLGTGAFTIEFWHRSLDFNYTGNSDYKNAQWGNATFITGVDSSGDCVWKMGANSPSYATKMCYYLGTGEQPVWTSTGMNSFSEGSGYYWKHYCIMRNGSTLRHKFGGSRYHPYNGSDYNISAFNDTTTAKIRIGGSTGTYGRGIHGQMSNVRVIIGEAIYWNDMFDPSHFQPLMPINNTVLLAANGSSITAADWGPGNSTGTVTTSGTNNATYNSSHPFDTYDGGVS